MYRNLTSAAFVLFLIFAFSGGVSGQALVRELKFSAGGSAEIVNHFGRVSVAAAAAAEGAEPVAAVSALSDTAVAESELKIDSSAGKLRIEVRPSADSKRIDLTVALPARSRVKVETLEGEVIAAGDLESIEVRTTTGTIAADVPVSDLEYELFWRSSRPRFLADFELEPVKERSAGRFQIKGRRTEEPAAGADAAEQRFPQSESGIEVLRVDENTKKDASARRVHLKLTTERGIILINVPPNEVSSDLRERPLTDAAKAIIRSGDVNLMESIRRATPKYFGEYERTLPPVRREPSIVNRERAAEIPRETVKNALVRVTDQNNRAVPNLELADFEITEAGESRKIESVSPDVSPFNLVLLLDVSGSVDNYVNFIRKAARNFVNTVGPNDRVSIVLFNDDVKVLSGFTIDKNRLSESLDTFDAGGATAYYDAVGYTLAETLRPLKGERTAVVILTDGDDNRSFLPFDSLLGSIQESGALIYPLYVPSSLVAASGGDLNAPIDPLRQRYMTLGSKAEGEGEKLAQISGGVYYPITQLSQIQTAYEDIVVQLRTAYNIKFRSATAADPNKRPSPRLKIKVNKPNAYAQAVRVEEIR